MRQIIEVNIMPFQNEVKTTIFKQNVINVGNRKGGTRSYFQ